MLDRPRELLGDRWVAVALGAGDAPALQAFYDANPLYSELAYGRPWTATAAAEELSDRPPADWPQGACRHWAVLERDSGRWLVYLSFVEDPLAAGVWHLGFLLVATSEHGSGLARDVHGTWVSHASARGARWLRLGVLESNERGKAFWEREGYREVTRRRDVAYGDRTHTLGVRVRPLGGSSIGEYLALVPRDRPGPA